MTEFNCCSSKKNVYARYPRVAIIILNWNNWKDTIECLESVYQSDYPNYFVIVVDNGSGNESVQKIKEYCSGLVQVNSSFFQYDAKNKPIEVMEFDKDQISKEEFKNFRYFSNINKGMILIKNKKNYGAAEGRNIGINFALKVLNPEYILLLDNDAVIPPTLLTGLIETAEHNKDVGVVAPLQFSYFNPKKQILRGHSLSLKELIVEILRLKRSEKAKEVREIDWVQISCMLVRKEVIANVGYLDSNFFYSWEDLDWCIRIRKAGYSILLSSKLKFWHKIDKPTKPTKKSSAYYYRARNAFLFTKKNKDYSYLIYFISTMILFTEFVKILKLGCKDTLVSFFRGILDGLKVTVR